MKKRSYIFLLSCMLVLSIRAQDSAFVRTYGGVSMDIGRDVKEAFDHGFVIAGTTSSFGQGNTSMYLVKTDSMGIHQWSKNYGGLYSDWGYSLEVCPDKGYLISGFSNSFSTNYDPYVVKTDSAGNLQWQRTYGTDDWDFIYGSAVLPDSGFVLCGETYGNAIGGSDGYVIRIDKNGNQLWVKNVGTVADDRLNKIIFLNNTLYAVGSTTVSGHQYGMIAKLDLAGNVAPLINMHYDTNADQELACITVSSATQLVMGGHVNPDGVNDINDWLLKTDTMGNILFNISGAAGANGIKRFEDIVCVDGDEIVTSGTCTGGNGGLGLFMVRFDANGVYLAADAFGGFGDEYGYAVTLTQNKHLAFVGSVQSYGCGDEDFYFIMNRNQHFMANSRLDNKYFCDTLDLAVVDIKEETKEANTIRCYPNPFSNRLTIAAETENNAGGVLLFELKDLSGRLICSRELEWGTTELELEGIAAGMYFYQVSASGKLLGSGKLIQHQ